MNLYTVTANGFASDSIFKTSYAVAPDFATAADRAFKHLTAHDFGSFKESISKTVELIADGVSGDPDITKLFLPLPEWFGDALHLYAVTVSGCPIHYPKYKSYVVASNQTAAAGVVQKFFGYPPKCVELIADSFEQLPDVPMLILPEAFLRKPIATIVNTVVLGHQNPTQTS